MLNRRTLLAATATPALALSNPMRAAAAAAAATLPAPIRTDWQDDRRHRTVPVLIRLPVQPGPSPVLLLSHGLGGSREGLAYLGTALAAGYVAVHFQHHGSDNALWDGVADPRASMGAALTDVGAALARLGDVTFALDRLGAGQEASLRGRTDLDRVGIAGHSYGAWTVAHMLGERLPLGGWGFDLPDRRLRAGIELSPIPPIGVDPGTAFQPVAVPILYVTGTEDRGWGAADWQARTVGFRNGTAPAVLAVLDGARHASFAGEAGAGPYWNDPRFQDRTARLSVLFLDAVLRDDDAARRTLLAGSVLSPGDRLESKGMAMPKP